MLSHNALHGRSRHARARLTPGLVAALGGLACAGSGRAAWTARVDTLPNGAVHVLNPDRTDWDPAARWTVEEDLHVGAVDGAPAYTFGRVREIAVDRADRIYVLDRQSRDVRAFAPGGEHVRTFGREGEGPGEFREPHGMQLDRSGHLWVADNRLRRFTVFDTAGALVATHRREIACWGFLWGGVLLDDGRVLDRSCRPGERYDPILVTLEDDGSTGDTIDLPVPATDPPTYDFRDAGGAGMIMTVPYAPGQVTGLDPRGFIWSGMSDRYRIAQLTLEGDTMLLIEREAPPVAVTAAERDTALAPIREAAGTKPVDPTLVPNTKPPFSRLAVDDRGFLWVERPLPAGTSESLFDVFEPTGRLAAEVRTAFAPAPYTNLVIVRDHFYAVVRDDLDAPFIVRARVRRGGS